MSRSHRVTAAAKAPRKTRLGESQGIGKATKQVAFAPDLDNYVLNFWPIFCGGGSSDATNAIRALGDRQRGKRSFDRYIDVGIDGSASLSVLQSFLAGKFEPSHAHDVCFPLVCVFLSRHRIRRHGVLESREGSPGAAACRTDLSFGKEAVPPRTRARRLQSVPYYTGSCLQSLRAWPQFPRPTTTTML